MAYQTSAQYYDSIYSAKDLRDAPFYLELARRCGGSVLELGCGTGRITLPLARAGFQVTALDLSPAMLGELARKLQAEPADVQARVQLVEGDMAAFALEQRFGLVITPFRSFQHLLTVDAQLACLACVARHLAPGGRFVLDVFKPDERKLAANCAHGRRWTQDLRAALPDGGVLLRSVLDMPDLHRQVLDVALRYEDYGPDCRLRGTVLDELQLRWLYRYEALHLLALAGFAVEAAFGGYEGEPLDGTAREMLFVCALKEESHD